MSKRAKTARQSRIGMGGDPAEPRDDSDRNDDIGYLENTVLMLSHALVVVHSTTEASMPQAQRLSLIRSVARKAISETVGRDVDPSTLRI